MKEAKVSGPIAELIKLIAEITVTNYITEQKEKHHSKNNHDQSKHLRQV